MPMEDGEAGLLIFETCTNLLRTLPTLVYDQVRVEDVDSDGEDHAADALRYALAWKVRGPRRAPDTVKDYWARARTGSLRQRSD